MCKLFCSQNVIIFICETWKNNSYKFSSKNLEKKFASCIFYKCLKLKFNEITKYIELGRYLNKWKQTLQKHSYCI